jgi:hypothetical protein
MEKVNCLNEFSGFNNLVNIFEENKEKNWTEWLNLETVFEESGKQGIIGILSLKDNPKKYYVFKISQNINHLINHEINIMKSLNEISNYCPHFCRGIDILPFKVDLLSKKNPLNIENSKKIIEKDGLLMEYLKNCLKFCDHLKSKKISEKTIFSTIKQVLLAISIAQDKKKFSHYDLHSDNVMMKKCDKDLVFLYVLNEDEQYCVPTYGYYPVIIDFGFSYTCDVENDCLYSTLNFTNMGFTTDRFDKIVDPKLFLVTVSREFKKYRNSKNGEILSNITHNLYDNLDIDWNSGWFEDKKSANDYLISLLGDKKSSLFVEYEYYCIDILNSLIVLPIQKQEIKDIRIHYINFIEEFIKIEMQISTPLYSLYILKNIVDCANMIRVDYIKEDRELKNNALEYFKHFIYQKINSIMKYCIPKNINFEKMLSSLFFLVKCMEGVLYEVLCHKQNIIEKRYDKLPIKNPEEIYNIIDINIQEEYVYNNKTNFIVIDCLKETCFEFLPTRKQIDILNSEKNHGNGGKKLYKMYLDKIKSC